MANTAQSKDRAAVKGGLDDLLGNVIRSDRQRAGRGNSAAPETATETPNTAPSHEPSAEGTVPQSAPSQSVPSPNILSSSGTVSVATPSPTRAAPDSMTDTHYDIMTNGQQAGGNRKTDEAAIVANPQAESVRTAAKPAMRPAQAPPRRKVVGTSTKPSASYGDRLSERVAEAGELASTPTMTVTLRIPQGFNEWLDGYVHGSWPEKIRKQELVVEGLMLAYARRGCAGEEVIGTALLGEDEKTEGP